MTIKAQIDEPQPFLYVCRHQDCRGYGHTYSTAFMPGQKVKTSIGAGTIDGLQCPFCHKDMELVASAD